MSPYCHRISTEVTLHVSVWVEMSAPDILTDSWESRSTWACELKLSIPPKLLSVKSHAPRERVSWNPFKSGMYVWYSCHAPRERVSWNCQSAYERNCQHRHAPRERVSWNAEILDECLSAGVTLHVSVWVEIIDDVYGQETNPVTLHVSVWVEIFGVRTGNKRLFQSRSTWACELKWHNGIATWQQ